MYNAATGKARSFESIVDILAEVLNINVKKEYIPNPFASSYQFHTQADLSKNANLEFLAKWSLEAGIADYADEIKEIFKKEQNA